MNHLKYTLKDRRKFFEYKAPCKFRIIRQGRKQDILRILILFCIH